MINLYKKKILIQLIASLTAIVLLCAIVVTYYFSRQNTEQVNRDLNNKITNLLFFSQKAYSFPVWTTDNETVNVFSEAILNDPEIVGVYIFQNDSLHEGIEKSNYLEKDPKFKKVKNRTEFADNELKTINKEIKYEDQVIGVIEIAYTTHFANLAIVKKQRELLIAFILVVLSGIALISLFIKSKLLKPIICLADFTKEIALSKDFNMRVDISGENEISVLGNGINYMMESLKQRDLERDKLEDKLRNVQNYLNNIIESMPSMLIAIDDKGIAAQ